MNIDDINFQIRGAVFEVNSVLGHGFLEKVYEVKRMALDLPEGQWKYYPATSDGYCLRQSNERSEWAAI